MAEGAASLSGIFLTALQFFKDGVGNKEAGRRMSAANLGYFWEPS